MNRNALVPAMALAPFALWSTSIMLRHHGYLGFVDVVRRDEPAAQMFVDLFIALLFVLAWMRRDARERGLPFAPYLLATLLLGSIGPLAYLVHRGLRAHDGAATDAHVTATRAPA